MRLIRILAAAALSTTFLWAQGLAIISTPPGGTVGVPYSVALTAQGGTPPYIWSETGLLPLGLNLSANGTLSGMPISAGTYSFSLEVTDAHRAVATRGVSVTISPVSPPSPPPNPVTITTTSLASGVVGQSYSQTLAATGGTPPYTWSISQGLPPGLTLDSASAKITGTPSASGSYRFQVSVADLANHGATASLTLTVTPPPLTITTAAPLFTGTVGAPYAQTFSASGGTPPYTWSILSGSTGSLTLDAAFGTLQGTPQAVTILSFTIQVADSAGAKAYRSFSLVIQMPALTITTGSPLPAGTVGVAYKQQISAAATGGTPPYTWSVTGLPPGITFDATGLTLSGTPTAADTFSLVLNVTDSAGVSATKTFLLTIAPQTLTIITDRQLTAANLGAPFNTALTAAGGTPPYTWSAAGLPPGLAMGTASGTISGTPTAAGTFNPVVITVTDIALNRYSDNFSIVVSLPALPAVTISGLPSAADPASQYALQISLASPYPAPIAGQAIIGFSPDSGPGDSTIAFASGGTTASFTIPAGSLNAVSTVPLAMQTGTASGTITISLRFQAGGTDITPVTAPSTSANITRAAPVIVGVQVTRSSNSITIAVTGYSTAREVTEAVFTFNAASGQSLQTSASSIHLDVSNAFSTWFGSSNLGGQFLFTQPLNIQGDPAAVIPTSVTLVNRIGTITMNINP